MEKILIIEDEEFVRDGISELLDSEGFEVLQAENGRMGIDIAFETLPDLVICDIMMPEVNGFDVINALRKNETTSTIPFIFLTARSEKDDIRIGMELGADDYLTKPFKAQELFNAVNTRLKKKDVIEQKSEEKLNVLRNNIAALLPHELRTPLNGILASSQLLMDYSDTMEEIEKHQLYQNINSSALRLNRLIMNYLYFAELEILHQDAEKLDKFKHDSTYHAPDMTLDEVFKSMCSEYDRTNDIIIDTETSTIQIFEEHYHKICQEIADNAFKFSLPDSKIIVSAKPDTTGGFYKISIKDHGRGLTNNQIKKIGAYMQFDRNMYEQQGSGLGLYIVKKLLKIYDGDLFIDSKLNEYTEVTLHIPLANVMA